MSGPLPVRIVSTAAHAIIEAAEWWAANRPKAPAAFVEELERALQPIASQPAIGARAQNAKLTRVRYYLYYRIAESPPAVEVLALWHTSRGSAPPM